MLYKRNYMKKTIITNRTTVNKSVRKKPKMQQISLTFEQYENILIGNISSARICNIMKVNVDVKFFKDLKMNKLPEYKEWFNEIKGK